MSIVAHWKLNDNLATDVVIDETGVNNGILTDAGGTATTAFHSVKGVIDRAQTFDGVDDLVAVADDNSLDVTSITMAAWVNLDATWAALGHVLAKMDDYKNGIEKANDIYRSILPGGCKMFSKGDNCMCFLCQCDRAVEQRHLTSHSSRAANACAECGTPIGNHSPHCPKYEP